MKTLTMNLSGIKASAKDGNVELNKTAMSLKNIAGIDVYSDKKRGEIKSTTQILDDLSKKWKNLSEEQQYALGESIAGKNRANVFQSLMQNFDKYKEMMGLFNNNDFIGSAMTEKQHSPYVQKCA